MFLSAQNITYAYERPLFSDISFEADCGECVSFMGASGSGKSTLLHILSSFLRPQKGRVELFDKDIYSLSQSEILHLRRKDIGIIFQQHYLFWGFTARENIAVTEILSGEELDKEVLSIFNISEILEQNIGSLSGGQAQRLSIARILTKRPRIIFADEPTGNLDRESAMNVMQLLFDYIKLTQGVLIFVTHDPLLAGKCDRRYRLEDLKLIEY